MSFFYTVLPLLFFFFTSCASIQYPEGGNKDTTPPQLLKTSPPLPLTNFKKKSLNIYFNEYIKNEDYSKGIFFSPLISKSPKVMNYSKKIKIVFNEPLQDTITYLLTLGKNIKDYNEGNPLNSYYQFPITPANAFDTCKVQTKINIGHPLLKFSQMYIAIYLADSIYTSDDYYQKNPIYLFPIESDSTELCYIHPNRYKIIAFQDINNDRRIQKNELIAFHSENLINLIKNSKEQVSLILFPSDDTPPKVKKITWRDSLTIDIETNEPIIKDSIIISSNTIPLMYRVDENKKQLITLYFKMPVKDNMQINIHQLTDTLGNKADTILKLAPPKLQNKNESLKFNQPIVYPNFWKLTSNFPFDTSIFSYITIKDTNQKTIILPYRIHENAFIVDVSHDFIDTTMVYSLVIDSNLTAFQGQKPDSTIVFSIKPLSYNKLCKLSFEITTNYNDFIGILKHKETDTYIYFEKDESEFEELLEGTYELIIIDDRNHNKRWDTGKLEPFQYPERLYIHPSTISLKPSLHPTLQIQVQNNDF